MSNTCRRGVTPDNIAAMVAPHLFRPNIGDDTTRIASDRPGFFLTAKINQLRLILYSLFFLCAVSALFKYGQPEGSNKSNKSLTDVYTLGRWERGDIGRRIPGQTESLGQLCPKRRIDLRRRTSRCKGRNWRPAQTHAFDLTGVRHFGEEQLWKLLANLGDDVVVQRLTAIHHREKRQDHQVLPALGSNEVLQLH